MHKIVNNAADQAMIHFSMLKSVKWFYFTGLIGGVNSYQISRIYNHI